MSIIAGLPSIANVAPEALPLAPASAPTMPAPSSSAADFRLVIEEDETRGGFIYKTIDRRTGEVIQQLPRADVLKLRDEADYAAGAVHDAQY